MPALQTAYLVTTTRVSTRVVALHVRRVLAGCRTLAGDGGFVARTLATAARAGLGWRELSCDPWRATRPRR